MAYGLRSRQLLRILPALLNRFVYSDRIRRIEELNSWCTLEPLPRRESLASYDGGAGGHEQLISKSVPAFAKRDKKQTMIDLRGISTNWFKNQLCPSTICFQDCVLCQNEPLGIQNHGDQKKKRRTRNKKIWRTLQLFWRRCLYLWWKGFCPRWCQPAWTICPIGLAW